MTTAIHNLYLSPVARDKSPTDLESAWSAFTSGSADEGGRLYDAIGDQLYGLALWMTGSREDACDVVQSVFLKLLRRRSKLDRVRKPRSYLLRMTRHASVDLLRRRRPTIPLSSIEEPKFVADPGPAIDAQKLSRLVRRLPESQRATVFLRQYCDLSFREIGQVMQVSIFTAASRYRLALGRLRRGIGEPE